MFVGSSPDSKIHSDDILSLISDPLPPFCIIYDCKFDYKTYSYLCYDYSTSDALMQICSLLIAQNWILLSSLIKNIDLDGKFDNFLLSLHTIINKNCPQKR